MRRTYLRAKEKKEIMKLMGTCRQTCDELVQRWRAGEIGAVQKILADMQTGMISIGEIVENIFGEFCETITKLEEYCEILYQISLKLSDKSCEEETITQLKQETFNVYNQLSSINTKTEIVFFPYKASMWDCMESIWEEAIKDEECLVYVVPIPYFEKDSSGALSKVCYEGKRFPANVQITPYREFHLEQERPDIIYIHNAYEDQNLVTSVHPDYFASHLKKYTDILVYIPYYISGKGPMPEMHCNLPGYRFVDKIIVQDEEKKESLLEFVEADKILVLGNPKADRLLKLGARRQEILEKEIPKEWRDKISGKKVFFYNTSLNGLLEYSADAIDKIRYVISRFDERTDAVLLWRPHPLSEGTLRAMRPEMYQEIRKIKKDLIEKNNCIIDESADGTISAVISDAYIGEYTSSMVHYFGILEKPVFYIEWKQILELTREERRALLFYDFFPEGDSIWFVPYNAGLAHCLCRVDLNNGKTDMVKRLPGKPQNAESQGCYQKIYKHENKLILIPFIAGDIYIYDMERGTAIKLVLEKEVPGLWFSGTIKYKNKLFLIPECYPALVEIDLLSMRLHEIEECIIPFRRDDTTVPMFLLGFVSIGSYLYMASASDNRMLIYHMESGEAVIKKIGKCRYGFISMVHDGKYFWLSSWKDNLIVRWEETGYKEYRYPIQPGKDMTGVNALIVDCREKLLLFCGNQQDIILINKENGECDVVTPCKRAYVEKGLILGQDEAGYKMARQLSEQTIVAFDWYDYSILIWNLATGKQERFPCRMPDKNILEVEKEEIEKKTVRFTPYAISEIYCGISKFIDCICNCSDGLTRTGQEEYANLLINFYEGSGKMIHRKIKELITEVS